MMKVDFKSIKNIGKNPKGLFVTWIVNWLGRFRRAFCSDDETIGLVQEIYGTKVNKGICCVFRYNNLPAKNVLPEYVCDYKKRAGLFQRSADLE